MLANTYKTYITKLTKQNLYCYQNKYKIKNIQICIIKYYINNDKYEYQANI